MTTRILPPGEWVKLNGTEAETIWPHLNPFLAQVMVVEDGDAIVGCWILMPVWHAECLWIAPAHRKIGSVARKLWRAMREAVLARGSKTVTTASMSEDVTKLLEKVGAAKIPGDHFVMTFQERVCQPSLSHH